MQAFIVNDDVDAEHFWNERIKEKYQDYLSCTSSGIQTLTITDLSDWDEPCTEHLRELWDRLMKFYNFIDSRQIRGEDFIFDHLSAIYVFGLFPLNKQARYFYEIASVAFKAARTKLHFSSLSHARY
jgi:hypothetical protein